VKIVQVVWSGVHCALLLVLSKIQTKSTQIL
jgi:hypothetical protein